MAGIGTGHRQHQLILLAPDLDPYWRCGLRQRRQKPLHGEVGGAFGCWPESLSAGHHRDWSLDLIGCFLERGA